jgi:hypothetical protein
MHYYQLYKYLYILDADAKKSKLEEMTKKERKKQRKMVNTNYVLSVEAKQLWEKLRRYLAEVGPN